MKIYFSDFFEVPPRAIERHGAFNISLLSDLPLFIDPFLLFNSRKRAYRRLHDEMIGYLRFLRDKSVAGEVNDGLLRAWYRFPEVGQTWLGFTQEGNRGSGLGGFFAQALHENLAQLFSNFGRETITKASHLEKLCLIKERVGRDNISDFTTNLIHGYLLEYTQQFTVKHIPPALRRRVAADRVRFNYETESWEREEFDLPWLADDYVLLTPKDILTKDDTWINKHDLIRDFDHLPDALPNDALRAQVNNYFHRMLPRNATKRDEDEAASKTIRQFPALIDAFIKYKEDTGDQAVSTSEQKVADSHQLYLEQFREFAERLARETPFYQVRGTTHEEAMQRVLYMKDQVENKGAHRIFYLRGKPLEREEDLQILYRLTWYASPLSVSREVNDGRGPADYLVSYGAKDKTIVEFKLAKNSQLKRNLERQAEIYQKASDAKRAIKVILYFTRLERARVESILKALKMTGAADIVLIDARKDNKPSGSKA